MIINSAAELSDFGAQVRKIFLGFDSNPKAEGAYSAPGKYAAHMNGSLSSFPEEVVLIGGAAIEISRYIDAVEDATRNHKPIANLILGVLGVTFGGPLAMGGPLLNLWKFVEAKEKIWKGVPEFENCHYLLSTYKLDVNASNFPVLIKGWWRIKDTRESIWAESDCQAWSVRGREAIRKFKDD